MEELNPGTVTGATPNPDHQMLTLSSHTKRTRALKLCAAAGYLLSLVLLGSLIFSIPLYLRMQGLSGHDGEVVMYSHDQYTKLLSSLRCIFFVCFPVIGIVSFALGFTHWKSVKSLNEMDASTQSQIRHS
jgi:hypothetical protein